MILLPYHCLLQDESTLEKIIKRAEVSGESKYGVKRQLLNLYCKNNNLEKATAFKEVKIYYKIVLDIILCNDLYLFNI